MEHRKCGADGKSDSAVMCVRWDSSEPTHVSEVLAASFFLKNFAITNFLSELYRSTTQWN